MGGGAMAAAAVASGALVITGGKWSTERKIDAIVGMGVTSVVGSLSYILHLTEVAASLGVDLASCGVRRITCFGEPGLAVEETSAKFADRFGGATISDGYGLTEIFGLGYSCEHRRSVHLPDDMVLVECLRPGTNEPVAPGELGELVFTNLVCDTQPLLRYRSADLGRLSDGSVCECGDTNTRIEKSVEGRVDDMIWYHGANFFPSAVQAVLSRIDGVESEFFQIVLTSDKDFPKLSIRVERSGDDDARALDGLVSSAVKDAVGVNASIDVLPSGALPRPKAGEKFRHIVRTQE
jgi:phenylacetate-CoA ligase